MARERFVDGVFCFRGGLLALFYFNPPSILGAKYLPCLVFSTAFFVLLSRCCMRGVAFRWVCDHSYEIYLVHHRVLYLLMPVFLHKGSSAGELICACFTLGGLIALLARALKSSVKVFFARFEGLR